MNIFDTFELFYKEINVLYVECCHKYRGQNMLKVPDKTITMCLSIKKLSRVSDF